MVINELYRVVTEGTRIRVMQEGATYYEGVAAKMPISLMDSSISTVVPDENTIVVILCE